MKKKSTQMRVPLEFQQLILEIQLEAVKKGKRKPTQTKVLRALLGKIKKGELICGKHVQL